MSPPPELPVSTRFALWYAAWVAGGTSLDEARDAIVGSDAGHDVVGLPDDPEPCALILAMGRIRSAGAFAAGLALPVPGDPLGVAGPPGFNADALEVGEGVILEGTGLGLVPQRTGARVLWRAHRAITRRQVPDLPEADAALREAVRVAADALADMDVARWRPEVADELMNLRRPADLRLPPMTPPRVLRVLSLSLRCQAVVDLALEHDGAAVTAQEAEERRAALLPLGRAARRGLVAACSSGPGR